MIKLSTILLFSFIFSTQNSLAGQFKFNYKNLNTLAALICSQDRPETSANSILLSKVKIDKLKKGQLESDITYELSGSCNVRVSKSNKEVISYGEELQIEINLKDLSQVSGTLGVKQIEINFNKKNLLNLTVNSLFEDKITKLNLKNVNWAINNSLFNINKKNLISVKQNGRLIASEHESNLVLKTGDIFYNIWSYEAFACHSLKPISNTGCEKLTDSI